MAKFVSAALEGDFSGMLAEVVEACGRRPAGEVRFFGQWREVAELARQPNHLAAVVSGGWTVLVDDWEFTGDLYGSYDTSESLANRFGVRVVTAIGHSVSGMCGYQVYSPDRTRSVLVTPDGLIENLGDPLAGEEPIDADTYNERSVLDTLRLLGLDLDEGVESSTRCAAVEMMAKDD